MVYINIYEDITNDDVILIGNSGGYIDKIKFIKLAQNTDYNDIENWKWKYYRYKNDW